MRVSLRALRTYAFKQGFEGRALTNFCRGKAWPPRRWLTGLVSYSRYLDPNAPSTALAEARRIEFRNAADVLQAASVQHLNYPDGNISCSPKEVTRLRSIVYSIRPDVVLLPWFLDGHVDHRRANVLYALACGDLEAIVLGYEIWSMLEPNAVFDITDFLSEKLLLIRNYPTQLRTVEYVQYVSGLASVRAYQAALQPRRAGAAEAFVALPNREYCEQVCALFEGQLGDTVFDGASQATK